MFWSKKVKNCQENEIKSLKESILKLESLIRLTQEEIISLKFDVNKEIYKLKNSSISVKPTFTSKSSITSIGNSSDFTSTMIFDDSRSCDSSSNYSSSDSYSSSLSCGSLSSSYD